MSTFNSLYKSESNLSPNYYEKKIKEGIPIFQEIGIYNNKSMNNPNYVDPFKLLENNKTNNFLNNGGNESSFSNINMYDVETRKIIEREMNPYILQMKNELNVIIEKFRKEIEDKSNIINEISLLKEQISQNNRNNEAINSNIEEKILNMKDMLKTQDKKLNVFQNNFNQINKFNQDIIKKTDELYLNINDVNKNNNKFLSMDNENMYSEITNNIQKLTNSNYEQLNRNVDLLKEEISSIKKELYNNNTKLLSLNTENNINNKTMNDIKVGFSQIKNQIDNINIDNHKNLNLINNFEIKNNEFQQNIKSLNDKISTLNANLNTTYIDVKSYKQLINSSTQKISDIENSIRLLKNEKQSFNNKIMELNLKVDSQDEKIIKNNNVLNDVVSQNNTTLYKDLTIQISKSKDLIDNLRDKYDSEINQLRSDLEQFDLIIKKNPFLNMNENERLSILFKKEQLKSNDTFRENIKLLTEEINKLKNANPIDKENLKKINDNFKIIDKSLTDKAVDIQKIGKVLKTYSDIIKALSEKVEELKKDKNTQKIEKMDSAKKVVQDVPIISEIKFGSVKDDIKNMQQHINNLKIDIQEIVDKTIPDIYKYINEQLKGINNIKSQKIEINNNNDRYPVRISDVSNHNNINNKNPVINSNSNNNLFNQNSISKNNKNIINNVKNNNENNNIIKKPSNQIPINDKNIDDIVNKIELMGAGGNNNLNNEFNNKQNNYNNKIDSEIRDNNESKFDKNSSFNDWRDKKDESNSININDILDKKQDVSKFKNSFESDFDN